METQKTNFFVGLWEKATKNIFKTAALIAAMSAISATMVEFYTTYSAAKEVPALRKEIKAILKLERERVNIMTDVLRAELDHNASYEDVEHTNGGDAWYFSVEKMYDKEYQVIYGASYKKKQRKFGYIDFENEWHWITVDHNHNHK